VTWILGAAIPFGYAALISDVRVTFPDGSHRDILQKVYPVGPMLLAGFAGSVEIGFRLIQDLQHYLHLPNPPGYPEQRAMWYPQQACWQWRRRARRLFSEAPADRRALGAGLIVAAVTPFRNGPFGLISRCVRMRAPEFLPERIAPVSWTSIGSGSQHQDALRFADVTKSDFMGFWAHGETNNPGGAAMMVAVSVAIGLMKDPVVGVSQILQVARVTGTEHTIQALSGSLGWRLVDEHPPARSWSDFVAICSGSGLHANAAAC
jgi:hypothetical protein